MLNAYRYCIAELSFGAKLVWLGFGKVKKTHYDYSIVLLCFVYCCRDCPGCACATVGVGDCWRFRCSHYIQQVHLSTFKDILMKHTGHVFYVFLASTPNLS